VKAKRLTAFHPSLFSRVELLPRWAPVSRPVAAGVDEQYVRKVVRSVLHTAPSLDDYDTYCYDRVAESTRDEYGRLVLRIWMPSPHHWHSIARLRQSWSTAESHFQRHVHTANHARSTDNPAMLDWWNWDCDQLVECHGVVGPWWRVGDDLGNDGRIVPICSNDLGLLELVFPTTAPDDIAEQLVEPSHHLLVPNLWRLVPADDGLIPI
jgi:hypothetical protein